MITINTPVKTSGIITTGDIFMFDKTVFGKQRLHVNDMKESYLVHE